MMSYKTDLKESSYNRMLKIDYYYYYYYLLSTLCKVFKIIYLKQKCL